MFHVRNLHLGHLAKAFALREAPSEISRKPKQASTGARHRVGSASTRFPLVKGQPRKTGRVKINSASEFQIAKTNTLDI
jgi:ATP-dependent RNA helicase DDX31/DBP7